jgi:hypothetical protein
LVDPPAVFSLNFEVDPSISWLPQTNGNLKSQFPNEFRQLTADSSREFNLADQMDSPVQCCRSLME